MSIKPVPMCCGTCASWDLKDMRTPSGRINKNKTSGCEYEIVLPTLPNSATTNSIPKISKVFMEYHDGQDCPCWSYRIPFG